MNTIKNLTCCILLMLLPSLIRAQQFSGIATYKTSSGVSINMGDKVAEAEQERIQQELAKKLQKEYTLHFSTSESCWQQIERLDGGPAQPSSGGMDIIFASGGKDELLYKNIASGLYEKGEELMGKRFIIMDTLPQYDWKLTSETKKIGQYNCQKAIYTKIIDAKKFSSDMEKMETTRDTIETTAWFTMDIPVNNGPNNYHGLPGLILEVKTGKRIIVCNKIVLNPDDAISIIKPKKGKIVTAEEYKLISEEKIKEMMKQYKPSDNSDATISISIGG